MSDAVEHSRPRESPEGDARESRTTPEASNGTASVGAGSRRNADKRPGRSLTLPVPSEPVDEKGPGVAALTDEQRGLVRENVGLVSVHLRRFVPNVSRRRSDREWDDLFQEGCLGLIRAAAEFRPERGIPFAAFALPRIHTAVRRVLVARQGGLPAARRDVTVSGERTEDSMRADPNRPPKMRSISPDAARRLRDRRRHTSESPGEGTAGERLREKYERAVKRAAEEVLGRAAIRDDRDELVRVLTEERYLVPHEDDKRSYRKIARQTQSSFARVAQCDRHLSDAIRRALEADPEFAELRYVVRTDPDGVDAPVDEAMDRTLARLSATELLARFRGADDARRANLMRRLLVFSAGELEHWIGAEIERLPGPLREQLHHEMASELTGGA